MDVHNGRIVGDVLYIEVGNPDDASTPTHAFQSTRTVNYPSLARTEVREDRGRKCWTTLHAAKDWTEADLLAWEETIPGYECGGGCKRFYLKYKEDHPPEYDENGHLKFEWGYGLHNAVNTKLEKEVISLERAIEIWQHARNSPSS